MSTAKLIRAAGLAAMVGSVFMALFPILHPNHDAAGYQSALWIPAHLSPHIAMMTYIFALPAIFARQGERNGRLGLAAYIMATLGSAQLLMLAWVELFVFPFLGLRMPELDNVPPPGVEIAAPLMQASLALGYGLLGLSIVRAGVLPRGSGVLLLIAAPLFGLGDMVLRIFLGDATPDLFFASTFLLSAAMGWVGLGLWRGRGERRASRPVETAAGGLEPAPSLP